MEQHHDNHPNSKQARHPKQQHRRPTEVNGNGWDQPRVCTGHRPVAAPDESARQRADFENTDLCTPWSGIELSTTAILSILAEGGLDASVVWEGPSTQCATCQVIAMPAA